MKPRMAAIGVTGSARPIATISSVVAVNDRLGRYAPSRSTVAVGITDDRSRSAACCERHDCQKVIATPSATMVTMISASTRCPRDAAIALARSRMTTRGFGEEVEH